MNPFTLGFATATAMCGLGLMTVAYAHARTAVLNAQSDVVKTTAGFTTLGAIMFVVAGALLWPASPYIVVGAFVMAVAAILRVRDDYAQTLLRDAGKIYPTGRRR